MVGADGDVVDEEVRVRAVEPRNVADERELVDHRAGLSGHVRLVEQLDQRLGLAFLTHGQIVASGVDVVDQVELVPGKSVELEQRPVSPCRAMLHHTASRFQPHPEPVLDLAEMSGPGKGDVESLVGLRGHQGEV